ncbi:superoxide dismutase [Mn], mitochondrial-like [Malaya genurostris]|uniref:superoxide dismutase [Mn], mitochondrial-like n=1 Tax=Malaya genurostris TaxID=325434 RepID=UPI0026F38E3C|nr:superoxide dismutase [Mn], mitochondrial-like [Malaya genurostris]
MLSLLLKPKTWRVTNNSRKPRRSVHTLPQLAYDYTALEPTLCREVLVLHHQVHHGEHVTSLNKAESELKEAIASNDVSKVVQLGKVIRFHGGGHINHSLFWENLTPHCTTPSKAFAAALKHNFHSADNFKSLMMETALGILGPGWVWLGWHKPTKTLKIVACDNQDSVEATAGLIPVLGIDVWEHAYYIQYKNDRAKYFTALWDIINWKVVSKRYEKERCAI